MVHIVLCNCPPASAEPIARTLVEQRIAACVNMSAPIRSIYRWKGNVETDDEVTLTIKLPDEHLAMLRETIARMHPYELPELLVLNVDTARSSPEYLAWVRDVTSGAG
jgi:periplasmic divalent cation tolerance protein